MKRQCAYYDSKESLVAAFLQNNAVFHKSCITASSKQKLNHKSKYIELLEAQQHESGSSNDPELIDETSKRATRRSTDMKNFAQFFVAITMKKSIFINVKHCPSKGRTLCQRPWIHSCFSKT